MARTKAGISPHKFGQVPRADIPRSSFNLSHGVKTTFDADYLIPNGVWDVIPGDSWNVNTTIVARLATPLHPLMDNLYIDQFYFFVPAIGTITGAFNLKNLLGGTKKQGKGTVRETQMYDRYGVNQGGSVTTTRPQQ